MATVKAYIICITSNRTTDIFLWDDNMFKFLVYSVWAERPQSTSIKVKFRRAKQTIHHP